METVQPAGTESSLIVFVATFVALPSILTAEEKHSAAVSTGCLHACCFLDASHAKILAEVVFSKPTAPPSISFLMRVVKGHSSNPL